MEAEKTKLYIQNAIEAETVNAKANWGPGYNSEHEAYAVLKEEVEEAADDIMFIQEDLEFLWNAVKGNSDKSYQASLKHIKQLAVALATEAVQIAAVVNITVGNVPTVTHSILFCFTSDIATFKALTKTEKNEHHRAIFEILASHESEHQETEDGYEQITLDSGELETIKDEMTSIVQDARASAGEIQTAAEETVKTAAEEKENDDTISVF